MFDLTKQSTVAEQLGKLFLLGIPSTSLDDESKKLLSEIRPGFIILFDRNIESPGQLCSLKQEISNFLGYTPIFAIDQEGGVVTRLREGFTVSPGARATAEGGAAEDAYRTGSILAQEMASVGILWNLAPVVDINNNHQNPGIGIRSYGEEPDSVISYASAFLRGMADFGVTGCLKHFPGKGRVAVDAHKDMPSLDISREELHRTELRPFVEISADAWMPSHIFLSSCQTVKEPLTISREILTGLAREELGFQGVLVADDLTMGGLTKYVSPTDAIERTFYAGMDVLSVCHNSEIQRLQFRHLEKQIHRNSLFAQRLEESLARTEAFTERLLSRFESAPKMDPSNLPKAGGEEVMVELAERALDAGSRGSRDAIGGLRGEKPELILAPSLSRQVMVEAPQSGVPLVAERLGALWNVPLLQYEQSGDNHALEQLLEKAAGKRVLLFSENAHLNPQLSAFIERLCSSAHDHLLVAMRNPYDEDLPGVRHVVKSYGYARPQQSAMELYLKKRCSSGEDCE